MITRAFNITFKDEAVQAVSLKAGTWTFHAYVNASSYSIGLKDSGGVWHNYDLSDQVVAGDWYDVVETITTTFDTVEISLLNNEGTAKVLLPMIEKGSVKSVKRPNDLDIEEAAIVKSASWEIHTSSPVIYKNAPDLMTDGAHTPVTVTGRHWIGSTMTEEGFITVTANGDTEALTASSSPVTIAPANNADKHTYTIRLYNDANKTELLDWEDIPVVFKGATGVDALRLHINNPVDVIPADSDGNVLTFLGTGTSIHVFEGAVELDYDGIGTSNGKFKVTAVATNITKGVITDSGNVCVVADATAMPIGEEKASIAYTVTGKTLGGFDFTLTGEQNFSKTEMGPEGVGILSVIDYYGLSLSESIIPSTWQTTVPVKAENEFLWNYERVVYTDSTYDETEKRVIQGKDAKEISSIANAYAYSASDTVSPTSGWMSSIAALGTKPEGYFLWVREDITYTDSTSEVTQGYVVRDGEPGADGDGITSTTIHYAKSSSGTTPPSSDWSTSLPSPTQGWYMWTRTTTTYKFSPNTVAYSVSQWGNDGNPGLPGIQGPVVFQKEWVQGDTHRYSDAIRDYIYVRGSSGATSYAYTLTNKGEVTAGAAPVGGADVDGYDHVNWLPSLMAKVLIGEEANLANLIFKQEKLISIKGRTYNGTVLNYDEYIDYNFANTVSQPAVDSTSWTDLPSGTIYWVRYKKNTDLTWTVKQIGTGTGQWTLQFATAPEGATWYSSYSSGRYWARAKEGVVPPETTDYGLPFKITMLGEYDFTPNITLAGKDGNVDITGRFSTGNSGNKIVIDPINPEIRLADSGNNILSKIGFRNVTIGSQTYNQPYIELTQPSVSFTPRFISGPGKLELSNVTGFSDTLFLFDAIASKIELGITGSSPSIMKIFINNLPTSSSGLTSGQLWRNGSVINIIP